MAVQLIRRMAEIPPGYTSDEVRSNFASVEEATAQAVADLHSGAETRPVRIVDEDGNQIIGPDDLDKAATKGRSK